MKKILSAFLTISLSLVLFACGQEKNLPSETIGFNAKIIEVNEGSFLVEPLEGEEERNSTDRFMIPIQHVEGNREPVVGDILYIQYNGEIKEIYPAQVGEVYKITRIDTVAEMEAPEE